MRLPLRVTTRRLLVLVALIAAGFGLWDQARQHERAARFRQRAAGAERMIVKCREIVGLSPAECSRLNEYYLDNPYYNNQAWTGRMIPYFTLLRDKYLHAADHPRDPVPPDPPTPD